MKNIQTIEIYSQEVKDGKKSFIASTAKIGGKWYKIKFVNGTENAPKERGIYYLTINFDFCSLERGKPYTSSTGRKGVSNDTIWVRKVENLYKLTDEELQERNRETFDAIFTGEN